MHGTYDGQWTTIGIGVFGYQKKKIRIGGTSKFLTTNCSMPALTVQDNILKATKELVYALSKKNKKR